MDKHLHIIVRGCLSRLLMARLLSVILFSSSAFGASVSWDAFEILDWNDWGKGCWELGGGGAHGIGFSKDGDVAVGFSTYDPPYNTSYWVYAAFGDELPGISDFQNKPLAADLYFVNDTTIAGENIDAHRDVDGIVYLAVITYDGSPTPVYHYGWVELQDRTILSSAYSDMPLIVGTDLVIPEPSSALLLLLGCAGLALRRRRLANTNATTGEGQGYGE